MSASFTEVQKLDLCVRTLLHVAAMPCFRVFTREWPEDAPRPADCACCTCAPHQTLINIGVLDDQDELLDERYRDAWRPEGSD